MDNKFATLENFLNNPGLQHLAEEIFVNINSVNSLEACQEINQSSKEIFETPFFWLKKFVQRGLSKKNQEDWMKVIQSAKNSDKEKHLLLFFKWTQDLLQKGASESRIMKKRLGPFKRKCECIGIANISD